MKKANTVLSLIIVIIVLVGFGIISLIVFQEFKNIKPELMLDLNMTESQDVLNETETRYPSVIDGLILFIFVGLWVAGLVSALVKEEHPIIFGMMMFLLIFVVLAGAILGNFYEEFFQDSDFTGLTATFPVTNWLLTHMLEIGIVIGLSILFAMMAKNSL